MSAFSFTCWTTKNRFLESLTHLKTRAWRGGQGSHQSCTAVYFLPYCMTKNKNSGDYFGGFPDTQKECSILLLWCKLKLIYKFPWNLVSSQPPPQYSVGSEILDISVKGNFGIWGGWFSVSVLHIHFIRTKVMLR